MNNPGFVFPGQGAQYVGMGRELAEQFPLVREYFTRADDVLGFKLSELCWQGPADRLTLTENAQPAILALSCAIGALVERETGLSPRAAAGLSLGEYSALVQAGMLDFETAVALVARRGRYMQEAVPPGEGGMAAVIGLDAAEVEALCQQAVGTVQPANFNCPGQVVVSGERKAVAAVVAEAKAAGARRAMLLAVSAPFHSSLLLPAEKKLAADLQKIAFRPPAFPVWANVDARPLTVDNVWEKLARQVASPVRWQQCVEQLATAGVGFLVEAGPGHTLSAMVRKTVRGLPVYNVELVKELEKLKEVG